MLRFQCELIKAHLKVSDHGNPDLSEHGVGSSAEESFDLEVLFDALEEQLDLPAGFVDVHDRSRSKFEVVRQERICFTGFEVDVSDASQFAGILSFGIEPGEDDLVIGGDTGALTHLSTLESTVLCVRLQPGHEVYLSQR